MVEGARLEYECAGYTAPWVRIPPSPLGSGVRH